MQLLTGTPQQVSHGDYVYVVTIGTGTAALSIEIEDSGLQQITDFSYSANANGVITLPTGRITATLTGDATIHIKRDD